MGVLVVPDRSRSLTALLSAGVFSTVVVVVVFLSPLSVTVVVLFVALFVLDSWHPLTASTPNESRSTNLMGYPF